MNYKLTFSQNGMVITFSVFNTNDWEIAGLIKENIALGRIFVKKESI